MKTNLSLIKILFLSLFLFILFDATVGKFLYKKFIKKQLIDVDISFGQNDNIYDHKFVKNYKSIVGWGDLRYKLCTDQNAFRIVCGQKKRESKKFDIAFIGDSFTEGTGLDYENTFVGIISKKLKNKKIANLAMTSYSTSIYFTKINQLIKEGYYFDEVVVFVDISDFPDDVLCYKVKNDKVIRTISYNNCYKNFNLKNNNFSNFFTKNFKFTNILKQFIENKLFRKAKLIDDGALENVINSSRSEWTYKYKKENFNGLSFDDAIKIPKKNMNDLYNLLNEHSIKLSIAVYPWPGTLKNDTVDNLQVKIWKDFCKSKCKKFYNFMPIFFTELKKENFVKTYMNFYISGDIHFNTKGNKAIADHFLLKY